MLGIERMKFAYQVNYLLFFRPFDGWIFLHTYLYSILRLETPTTEKPYSKINFLETLVLGGGAGRGFGKARPVSFGHYGCIHLSYAHPSYN